MAEGKEIDVAKEVAETAGVVAAKEIFIYYELVEFLKKFGKRCPLEQMLQSDIKQLLPGTWTIYYNNLCMPRFANGPHT